MTRHYPDLGSAFDWLKRNQPIRSTTQIWVMTRHQYGISALVAQTLFWEGSSGELARCQLFSQATYYLLAEPAGKARQWSSIAKEIW